MESDSKLVKSEFLDKQVQEESTRGLMKTISFETAVEREKWYEISRKVRFSQPSCRTGSVPPSQYSIGFGLLPASSHVAEMELECQNPVAMRLSQSSVKIEPDYQTPTERDIENQNPIEMMFKQPTVLSEFLPTSESSVKEEPYYLTPTERDAEYQKPINTAFMLPAVPPGFPITSENSVEVEPIKKMFIQPTVASGFLPNSKGESSAGQRLRRAPERPCKPHIPELASKPDLVGMKRKASQLRLPTRELYDRQLPLLNQDRQKTLPHSHFPDNSPQFQCQHRQLSSNTGALWWCSVCEIPCMNVHCFEEHLQGKKHKAKLEASVLKDAGKKWCQECNVLCMNDFSLAQHCNGKKHAARLLQLQRGYK